MQAEIHPNYGAVKVTCSCGETFETRSTVKQPISLEVCSKCHPFYTGEQKIVDTGGRIQKFQERFARRRTSAAKKEDSAK
ncbi:MAG: 50S ribosomal protein L31 [marine bacterium B5-7]|nr:MAG: 50S ribosomal protein L31 [marine bacterium B5-7]